MTARPLQVCLEIRSGDRRSVEIGDQWCLIVGVESDPLAPLEVRPREGGSSAQHAFITTSEKPQPSGIAGIDDVEIGLREVLNVYPSRVVPDQVDVINSLHALPVTLPGSHVIGPLSAEVEFRCEQTARCADEYIESAWAHALGERLVGSGHAGLGGRWRQF